MAAVMTNQFWRRDSTDIRVDAERLSEMADQAKLRASRDIDAAFTRNVKVTPERAGRIAEHLIFNLDDLDQAATGATPSSAIRAFIQQAALWLREAAATNEPVSCLQGDGPFEITVEEHNDPQATSDTALYQLPPKRRTLTLAHHVEGLDPANHAWVARILLQGFVSNIYATAASDQERQALINEAANITGNLAFDAFIAGLAEHLAARRGITVPQWVHEPDRQGSDEAHWPNNRLSPVLHQQVKEQTPRELAKRNIYIARADIAVDAPLRNRGGLGLGADDL